ncbi:MAG: AAA family ATPase [Actinomycetota bacterium]|nr:AAA family ATPase [Actinomycetota bacterium]
MEASETVSCPSCGNENREGSRFCGGCGGSLVAQAVCPSCGAANSAGQGFCNECGEALGSAEDPAPAATRDPAPAAAAEPAATSARPPTPIEAPDHLARKAQAAAAQLTGERKQVTVLFADVMGSMELAERTDPERWQTIMDGFFRALAAAVHRFEGTVDKFTGDGIMALFGAPIAHEDHAQRACYAALEMQRAVGEYADEVRRSDGISLTTRIGINSGDVVVGSIGDDLSLSYTAVGHTVGLAQRMEALAEPGKAYLTEYTARLAAGFLELRDLGEFEVKGASEPLGVQELTGVGSARGRLDVAQQRGFSPFVGRSTETADLVSAMERTIEGNGEAIGIVGDAGVGKSRLCHEFAEHCRARGIDVYEAQCQAHGKAIPLMPVLQMTRAYYGIGPADSERVAREKVAGRLLLLDPEFGDDLGIVFELLGIPDPKRPAPQMNAEARQRRLVDVIRRIVSASGRLEPAVILLEDLHWIDPASEPFLKALVEAVPGTNTLALTNFRPEYRAEWMSRSHYRQLPLAPLGPEALEELLSDLLGGDPSLDGLSEMIREQTGGNPFYVEEAVRELVESGALEGDRGAYRLTREIGELRVPPSVQAILSARIDRLDAPAKQTLQVAATIGKEFERWLLRSASQLGGEDLDAALSELVEAEFVQQTALYPEPQYAFRHPLTQEVAYGTQLAAARAATHAAIARGMQETDPESLDERAALIAQHFEQAGDAMQAAQWHARAAGWAGFTDPNAALAHWKRIRELDPDLPPGAEAYPLRVGARTMVLTLGWRLGEDVAEARELFEEGRALAEGAGDSASLAVLQGALGLIEATCAGNIPEYVRRADEASRILDRIEDPDLRVAASTALMYAYYLAGRYEDALASLDEVLELTADDPQTGAGIVLGNPRAWATSFRSGPLIALGRMDEARKAIVEGTELCRRWDREALGWSNTFNVSLVVWGGEPPGPDTLMHGRRAVEIAEEIGDAFSRIIAYSWLALAHSLVGDPEEAMRVADHCLGMIGERGAGLEFEPTVRGVRAEAYRAQGELDQAVEEGELALRLAEERGAISIAPRTRLGLAEILLDREAPGDIERAGELLDAAERIARDFSARPDVARSLRQRARRCAILGDDDGRDSLLADALDMAREMDARGLIEQIEADLGERTAV